MAVGVGHISLSLVYIVFLIFFYVYIWDVFFLQVHKEPIQVIPNSVTNRGDIEIEIYGMEGIPEKDIEEKRKQLKSRGRGGGMFDLC